MRRAAPMWLVQMPWLIGDVAAAALRRALQGVSAGAHAARAGAALVDEIPAERTLCWCSRICTGATPPSTRWRCWRWRPAAQRLLVIGTYCPAEVAGCEHSLASGSGRRAPANSASSCCCSTSARTRCAAISRSAFLQ
ncbi:MAG: hypothetical protein U0802_02110 [Candidatus Binatia bacterium]